jgi:hypothetical protein
MRPLYPAVVAGTWIACVQPAQALDVHGIRIGDRWSPAKFEQVLAYPTIPSSQRVRCTEQGEEFCVGSTRFLGVDVRMKIEGKDGQVIKITVTLPSDEFETALAALKHSFGEPTAEWSSPPDATAPLLFHHRVDWKLPQEELFVLQFATMSTLSFTRPEDSLASRYPPPL